MAGLLEYTKNGQVTEPPLYRFMRGNVQSFLNSIPDPSKMTPEQQLAMGLNANPIMGLLGTTAYHGSPYSFKKFDPNKIGTGEGAQVYGHGIYFAENPTVAESYADSVKNTEKLGNIWRQIGYVKDKLNKAIEAGNTEEALKFRDLSKKLHNWHAQNNMNFKGNVYKVDIPDEYVPKMLEWDKQLSEQSQPIKDVAANLAKSTESWKNYSSQLNDKAFKLADEMIHGKKPIVGTESAKYWKKLDKLQPDVDHNAIFNSFWEAGLRSGQGDVSGSSLYSLLSREYGDKGASEWLLSQGVPGIKYLDEGSRELGKGTSNYVVFDPSNVKILERKKGLLK